MINLSKVKFDDKEIKSIVETLKSGNVTQGKKVEEFEKKFAKYIGVKYAIAVNSGTNALYLGLLALGIGSGDEVLTTPFSFIASANSILYTGANPVFCDIDPFTFNIDPKKINENITNKTKAILPVHLFGLSCDMDEILRIAKKHKLVVIEDACQAHGAEYKSKKVGSLGDLGCFSFYATKNMTTIEGGMITTNNKKIADKLKLLRNHGSNFKYKHELLGYNCRMTELSAVIGLEQLKKLKSVINRRIKNSKYISLKLKDIDEMILPTVPKNYKHVFHQYVINISGKSFDRKIIINDLKKMGIESVVHYPLPLYKQKHLKKYGNNVKLPIVDSISKRVFSIPVHQYLTKNELNQISSVLSCVLKKKK